MRKFAPFIGIIIFIIACVFGVMYFLTQSQNKKEVEQQTANYTPLRATVLSGIITSTISCEGHVIKDMPEIYTKTITVDFIDSADSESFATTHKKGAILTKDEVLFSYKNKETKAQNNIKIIDIVTTEKYVQFVLLNYDKLYVVAAIDFSMLDLLDFDTDTSLILNNQDAQKSYKGKIKNFGYEVQDGKVEIQIKYEEKLLPGTPIKVEFTVSKKIESLYILKQMLQMDAGSYYVEVEGAGSERIRRDIEIGDFFDEYYDGGKTEFVEVKSGLVVGEKIIINLME